ncbi:MAG: 1-acyl-sn-glycerol-3-phosphate acyltransferase, partial [Proteobacteria bacterium]|nr:1-acyl-sn-glycerol-3-phosphate acyltransferase [Pseudomonadota bacterium]
MNPFAYKIAGFAIKTLSNLSKAKVFIHGKENVPDGSIIFVINHFTRIETLLLPYHIHNLTKNVPVWSLADFSLFKGAFGDFLEKVGAVSTKDPHRDRLIVKSLLTGEASWIIYPEGQMVKSKKIIEKGRFMIANAGGKNPPHTGAATLALRTEFYRQRLKKMVEIMPDEAKRIAGLFNIESIEPVLSKKTFIVPVNITYYPVRAYENSLSRLSEKLVSDIPERVMEEIMTEGTMLLSGVDIDIRFGKTID